MFSRILQNTFPMPIRLQFMIIGLNFCSLLSKELRLSIAIGDVGGPTCTTVYGTGVNEIDQQ